MEFLKILLVEDDVITAKDIKYRLEKIGYEVLDVISSGEEAVAIADELRPDIVLMDITLSGNLNGIEAATEIRMNFNIPIIFLTGYSDEDTILRAATAEPFGYIVKPVESKALFIAIKMALARYNLEKKVKENEQWLDITLRGIGDAVISTDGKERITFMNPVAEGLTGWSIKEAEGKPLYQVFNIDAAITGRNDDPFVAEPIERKVEFNTVLLARDGREISIDGSKTPIRDSDNIVNGTVSVFRDITEQKQNEEALRKSEKEKKTILNAMSELVVYIDNDKKVVWANNVASDYAGLTQREMVGRFCYEVLHGYREPCDGCLAVSVIKNGRPRRKEIVTVNERNWYIKVNPIRDRGQVVGVVEIVEDITERKEAEKALIESEKRLDLVLKGGNLGFWDWDVNTGAAVFNKRWATMLGYSIDEIKPHINSWKERIHPEDLSSVMVELKAHLDGKTPFYQSEHRLLTKSGEWRWILDNGKVMKRNVDKKSLRVTGIHLDITDRKLAADEIKRLNEELEKRVDERTMELESANRELKDFAYVVSHDLKAPLRGISQLTGWINKDYNDLFNEEGKEQMNLIINRVKRMDRLIEGILQYSRVGRIRGKEDRIDMNNLVFDVIELIMPPANISISVSNKLPGVIADRIRIEQIFQNLLSNAINYMDKPDGKISISSYDNGAFWQFSVIDNGPGIDPRYHDKIFQIFQTLTPRDEYESTGIGLSLVKKIIELVGGDIWIESLPGSGSRFNFTIPKKEDFDEEPKTDFAN